MKFLQVIPDQDLGDLNGVEGSFFLLRLRHSSSTLAKRSRKAFRLRRLRLSSAGGLEINPSTSNRSCGPPASSFISIRSSGWRTNTSRRETLSVTVRNNASRCHRLCAQRTSAATPCAGHGTRKHKRRGMGSSVSPVLHSTVHPRRSRNFCRRPRRAWLLKGLGLLSAKRSIS